MVCFLHIITGAALMSRKPTKFLVMQGQLEYHSLAKLTSLGLCTNSRPISGCILKFNSEKAARCSKCNRAFRKGGSGVLR